VNMGEYRLPQGGLPHGSLPHGSLIDRDRELSFTFDGRAYRGCHGDTLASALLANGVRVVGRSFKYHRPRGIYGLGSEDPSALVRLRTGARSEPNIRATQIELYDGLVAHSQNNWPSLRWDISSALGLISSFLPAGFYYKTFMWPGKFWPHYEKLIRHMAGMGRSPEAPDPDRYEKRHATCDVLVIGGGPAGMEAALAASASGQQVWLAHEGAHLGGGDEAARETITALEKLDNVTLLRRTTVFGKYDGQLYGLVERTGDHLASPGMGSPRQILWQLRTKHAVLASGAIERPLLFANNDRPGVMLTSAALGYLRDYAVRPGRRAVIVTNNDSAYEAAHALLAGGIEVAAIVDHRHMTVQQDVPGSEILYNHAVVDTAGKRSLTGVTIAPLDVNGNAVLGSKRQIDCDLLCLSGGFTPSVHLYSQAGGKLAFRDDIQGLAPASQVPGMTVIGAANGEFIPNTAPAIAPGQARRKQFIDLQNDVTAGDVELAAREGYRSIEHVKRYTTLGMGTDQGKTSNLNGIAVLAGALGKAQAEVGVTTYRPPYTPVTIGTLAGREVGAFLAPTRRTPMQECHEDAGAVFVPAGLWRRPHYYPAPGEAAADAVNREVLAVRRNVGIVDVSTLGRIDLHGPDVAEFLNRIYINGFKTLAVGMCRYGVMLRDDGMIFDDGTVARMADSHYIMTTTTANAGPVMAHLEYYLQVVWPELRVHLTSITDQWAVVAVAGPHARDLLGSLDSDIEFANQALPFMGWRAGHIGGIPAQVFRISFSGELAYEIAVGADHGQALWRLLLTAGDPFDVVPYGTEALTTLRTEKGHFVMGPEADGRATADDIGLGGMLSSKKDFVGRRSLRLPGLAPEGRLNLVGLMPADGASPIPPGAILLDRAVAGPGMEKAGHVATAVFSANLDKPIALAMVQNGRQRLSQGLWAHSPLDNRVVAVTIADPVFIDPQGERLRG
jgi:glycine cleavage system aminomethyltransferase T/NADPH-dependent 2,4-dienoyl-CoA reductase/sulfur reductase-like enzyme